jgi:hypothetical protein
MITVKSLLFEAGSLLVLKAITNGSFAKDGDIGRNYAKKELSQNPLPFFDVNSKVHKEGLLCLEMANSK